VQAIVRSAMHENGVPTDDVEFNSEGDTCNIHFRELDAAVRAADLAAALFNVKRGVDD
jgi:hypothetical protein